MTRKAVIAAIGLIAVVGPTAPAFAQAGGEAQTRQTPAAGQAAPGPIASTDGEQPGIRVDVTELERSGDSVTLKFSLVNDSQGDFTLADTLRSVGSGYNISGVYLLDMANKKKYQVVMDAEQNCVCSSNVPYTVGPGQSVNLWAKFPAPPAEVTEVGVVVPHFIPMDAVPIGP